MDYRKRIQAFQKQVQADLIFFPLSADLQYLTGIPRDLPNFGAVIHPGAWLEGVWMTPTHTPILTVSRMTAELGGVNAGEFAEFRVLGEFADPASLVKSIIQEFKIPDKPIVAIGDKVSGETVSALHEILPRATFKSATDPLRQLRMSKSEDEIAIMRQAGVITEAAFADVLKVLKHGMTELDVIAETNYQLRRHGALGDSFVTSMYNSGPNHPLLFGNRLDTWKRPLIAPVSLLFDFGAIYEGYCYDYGRTVYFGEPNAEQQRVYDLVMAAQKAGIKAMKAGQVTAAEVDAAARQVIVDGGYGEEFRHRLGHSIGLDVHEPPFLTAIDHTTLQEGMLFTVEPSITQFNTFSARVEDVVVARPGGGEPLTTGYQSLIVVE